MTTRRRAKEVAVVQKTPLAVSSVDDSRTWMSIWNSGPYSPWQITQGFQLDLRPDATTIQRNWIVFACQTLIAADMSKMGVKLVQWIAEKLIYQEVESPAVSPVLRKPNAFQTWPKFVQYWILSKLQHGNAYILKERDLRGVVVALYVLDACRVTPLIAEDGGVYYRLHADDLAGVPDGDVVVPASEIMHDRMWCLFHPLVGISPLFACFLAATQGLTIQEQSRKFFANGSRPGGLLTTPGTLLDTDMQRYKQQWETNFAGANSGRTAVLGNGLKYEVIRENAVDSQLVEQLKMSAEMICSTYHVPAYKVGVGAMPTYANAAPLNQIYYDDCLQSLIRDAQSLLDDGLDLEQKGFNVHFNIDDLLMMDRMSQMEFVAKGIEKAVFSPNEGRRRFNEVPVKGGEMPMLQQQVWPIDVLAKRPPPSDPSTKLPAPNAPAANDPAAEDAGAAKFANALTKRLMEICCA